MIFYKEFVLKFASRSLEALEMQIQICFKDLFVFCEDVEDFETVVAPSPIFRIGGRIDQGRRRIRVDVRSADPTA